MLGGRGERDQGPPYSVAMKKGKRKRGEGEGVLARTCSLSARGNGGARCGRLNITALNNPSSREEGGWCRSGKNRHNNKE